MSAPLITVVAQRHPADCGVSCLAMFLGVSYEDALIALGGEVPQILKRGVFFTELTRAADKLGARMRLKARWDAEADEGIAQVQFKKGTNHVVVVREGLFFDTDYSVWAPEDYVKAKKVKMGSLLVRED